MSQTRQCPRGGNTREREGTVKPKRQPLVLLQATLTKILFLVIEEESLKETPTEIVIEGVTQKKKDDG